MNIHNKTQSTYYNFVLVYLHWLL